MPKAKKAEYQPRYNVKNFERAQIRAICYTNVNHKGVVHAITLRLTPVVSEPKAYDQLEMKGEIVEKVIAIFKDSEAKFKLTELQSDRFDELFRDIPVELAVQIANRLLNVEGVANVYQN